MKQLKFFYLVLAFFMIYSPGLQGQKKYIKSSGTTNTTNTTNYSSSNTIGSTPSVTGVPTGYTRIFNADNSFINAGVNKRINVEKELAVSEIHNGANSAMWIFKPIPGTNFYRIENIWKKGQALYHTITPTTNALEADVLFGNIAIDDPRAQWRLENGPSNRPNTFKISIAQPSSYGHKLKFDTYQKKLVVSQRSYRYDLWELSMRTLSPPVTVIERDPHIPTELVRIVSANSPDYRINVEKELTVSKIHDGAWSAMWTLKPIEGEIYYRIENKWKKNGQVLNVNNHTLQFSQISENDSDGKWEIKRGTNQGEFILKSKSGFTIYRAYNGSLNIYAKGYYPPKGSKVLWKFPKV